MRKIRMIVALSVFAISGIRNGNSQDTSKRKIKFVCTCEDSVGSRYATALRDLIAVSPRYKAASEFIEGKGESATWNIGIRAVSLDPTVGRLGTSSVLSVVFTIGDTYIDQVVQSCLSSDPKGCAEDTLSSLDKDLAEILGK